MPRPFRVGARSLLAIARGRLGGCKAGTSDGVPARVVDHGPVLRVHDALLDRHATKYALEAISDSVRMEVARFGIDVVIVEPGGVRSEWSGIAADKVRTVSGEGAYADQGNAVAKSLASNTTAKRSSPPELIGRTIVKAVNARRPKTRYAVGFGAKPLILMHGLFPDRWFDALISRATGVPRANSTTRA